MNRNERIRQIQEVAQSVISNKSDPIDGCLQIRDLAKGVLPEEDKIYELFCGVFSELDDLPKGEAWIRASNEFKQRSLEKKASYRKSYGDLIKELCQQVIVLCVEKGGKSGTEDKPEGKQ